MRITSLITLGPQLQKFSQDEIKNEPMFFSADSHFAFEHGGKPTKDFIIALNNLLGHNDFIVDSRVHMLMPGWFPCIPGYHHDDVPRERMDGQPEYDRPSYRSKHAMVLYNGDICPTEFAIGNTFFTVPVTHRIVYKEWHKEVVEKIKNGVLTVAKAPDSQIVLFDDRTWHQGTQANAGGWRLFIRASWDTKREVKNEIRKQVQVYLENPMEGW